MYVMAQDEQEERSKGAEDITSLLNDSSLYFFLTCFLDLTKLDGDLRQAPLVLVSRGASWNPSCNQAAELLHSLASSDTALAFCRIVRCSQSEKTVRHRNQKERQERRAAGTCELCEFVCGLS